jgi:tetratricopeptide (TPR) repeat protein
MSLPSELPEIGSIAQRLRQNPRFDPVAAGLGPEDYFVWTRFDGQTTLKDLILMTGLATPRALDIVRKLRALGAILLPNETIPPKPFAPPPPPPKVEVPLEEKKTTRVAASDLRGDITLSADEEAALRENVELTVEERMRIFAMHRRVQAEDVLAVFGVADAADKKALKRAYFALSKEFHPDRFYGKRTGSFGARLNEIFEAMSLGYAILTDERAKRPSPPGVSPPPQSPHDHAADLFDRACQAEVSGDRAGALRLFAAALRLDAPAKYLRRAARCAMQSGEHAIALEYAKKAANLEPNDPSTARVLAQAFKAAGKLEDAEETLVLALMIKTENDQLAKELHADLAEVRRLAAR